METLFVISCDLPSPEDVPQVLKHLDPPSIPGFTGQVRVVVGQDVVDTIKFLNEG